MLRVALSLPKGDEREYREYLSEEQRSRLGCGGGRMPSYFVDAQRAQLPR